MRFICMILGMFTGKSNVRCADCKNLDSEHKCFGHKMPEDVINKTISCGFWSKKSLAE